MRTVYPANGYEIGRSNCIKDSVLRMNRELKSLGCTKKKDIGENRTRNKN